MALSAESTVVTGVLKIAANRQYQCSQKLPLTMANWQLDVFEKINVIHGSKPTDHLVREAAWEPSLDDETYQYSCYLT